MKMKSGLLASVTSLCLLGVSAACAQATPRNYERGPVTMVQRVDVKPGQLNAYMQDLAQGWRKQMEEGKRAGAILSYSIERPVDPRDGEPNLYLVTVYRDLASLDRPMAEAEKSTVAQFGSLDAAHELGMRREALRTIRGSTLMEALEFKK